MKSTTKDQSWWRFFIGLTIGLMAGFFGGTMLSGEAHAAGVHPSYNKLYPLPYHGVEKRGGCAGVGTPVGNWYENGESLVIVASITGCTSWAFYTPVMSLRREVSALGLRFQLWTPQDSALQVTMFPVSDGDLVSAYDNSQVHVAVGDSVYTGYMTGVQRTAVVAGTAYDMKLSSLSSCSPSGCVPVPQNLGSYRILDHGFSLPPGTAVLAGTDNPNQLVGILIGPGLMAGVEAIQAALNAAGLSQKGLPAPPDPQ